jgi:hypothetical protein
MDTKGGDEIRFWLLDSKRNVKEILREFHELSKTQAQRDYEAELRKKALDDYNYWKKMNGIVMRMYWSSIWPTKALYYLGLIKVSSDEVKLIDDYIKKQKNIPPSVQPDFPESKQQKIVYSLMKLMDGGTIGSSCLKEGDYKFLQNLINDYSVGNQSIEQAVRETYAWICQRESDIHPSLFG